MPNWCYGEIRVKGKEENKRKFLHFFLTENEEENKKKERYFARSWLINSLEEIEKWIEEDVLIFGVEVAWSINSCMVNGYPNDNSCPTIMDVSRELELDIQIASEEQGIGFTEFYHIKNGVVLIDECDDFSNEEIIEENYENTEEYYQAVDEWYNRVFDKFTSEFCLTYQEVC